MKQLIRIDVYCGFSIDVRRCSSVTSLTAGYQRADKL